MLNIKKFHLTICIASILSMNFSYANATINRYRNISSSKLLNNMNEQQIIDFCKNGKSKGTVFYIGCGKHTWEQADKELNRVYKSTLVKTKNKQKLRQSQRQWIKKRDEICDGGYADLQGDDVTQGGGTGVPIEFMQCMSDITNERIIELKSYKN